MRDPRDLAYCNGVHRRPGQAPLTTEPHHRSSVSTRCDRERASERLSMLGRARTIRRTPCHDDAHPPSRAGTPRNAVTRTPRSASAPLRFPEGDHACAQVTTPPPAVRRWPGSAAAASCARPPPPPPSSAPPARSPRRRSPRGPRPQGHSRHRVPPRPDQHPALHPARPARHRPRGHPRRAAPTSATRRVEHAGFVGRTAAAVPGRAGRRRHLRPPPGTSASRSRSTPPPGAPRSPTPTRSARSYIVHPFFGINFAHRRGRSGTRAVWRAFARDLNRAGRMARDAGLELRLPQPQLGVLPADRRPRATGLDVLTDETDPRPGAPRAGPVLGPRRRRRDPVDLIRAEPRPGPAVPRQGHEPGRQLRRPRPGPDRLRPDLRALRRGRRRRVHRRA